MAISLLEQVRFNQAANRWMYLPGSGKIGFVSANAIRAEIAQQIGRSQSRMTALTQQLYGGQITLTQWQSAVAVELRNAHRAYAIFGAGGRQNMTQQAWGRLGGNLRNEYRYLGRFAEQIMNGETSEAQALNRIKQYAAASEQSYTREQARSLDRPEWKNLPTLNQVPRDGGTRCHGNCKCEIVEKEDGLHWVQNPAEHCADCNALAAGGPYRPGRL